MTFTAPASLWLKMWSPLPSLVMVMVARVSSLSLWLSVALLPATSLTCAFTVMLPSVSVLRLCAGTLQLPSLPTLAVVVTT
jgi:hypothetical protein